MSEVLDRLNADGWYIYQLSQHGPYLGFAVILRREVWENGKLSSLGEIARGNGSTIEDALWTAWSAAPEPHSGEWEGIPVRAASKPAKVNLLEVLGLGWKPMRRKL